MTVTTFRVPVRHVIIQPNKVVFSHRWQGQWLTWIVPWMYVASSKLRAHHVDCPEPHYAIRLSTAYFETGTNELAA